MTQENKPREFWIADPDIYQCADCGTYIIYDDSSDVSNRMYEGDTMHVIEYSAYQAERKKLQSIINALIIIHNITEPVQFYRNDILRDTHEFIQDVINGIEDL